MPFPAPLAGQQNEDGHQFQLDSLPTQEKLIQNHFERCTMKGPASQGSLCMYYLSFVLSSQTVSKIYIGTR
jgi:hypothetical protein